MDRSDARQRKRQRLGEAEEDVDDKSLYICTVEDHMSDYKLLNRYRVQAIKLRDMFSFHDGPITICLSKSKFKSESSVLRDVAYFYGDGDGDGDERVADGMGFGVLGSQIVMAGGWSTGVVPKPSYTLDTTDPEAKFVRSVSVDMKVKRDIARPWLQEIHGKLYALSEYIFKVFDPKTQVWAPLQPLRVAWPHFPAVSASGTKIYATFAPSGRTFCFDVSSSSGSWTLVAPLLKFDGAIRFGPSHMILDLEDDLIGNLMFSYDGDIQVHLHL